MSKPESFELTDFLRADLLRARELTKSQTLGISGLQLWVGVLSPRFLPVALCRVSYFLYLRKLIALAKLVSLCNFVLFGIEIAVQCRIGKGFFLPHTQGTVIGAYQIGENAVIFQGVTLGARELDFGYQESSRPILGDGVIVGAGAKVLGPVKVGSGSRIGANAVVLESIPANVLAVGIPARVIESKIA